MKRFLLSLNLWHYLVIKGGEWINVLKYERDERPELGFKRSQMMFTLAAGTSVCKITTK